MAVPVKKVALHCPSLDEVAKVLQNGLATNFAEVQVSVVDCPDLTQKPFMLAAKGLCGKPRVADVGGASNVFPMAKFHKKYNLIELVGQAELPNSLVIGPATGPYNTEGVNTELMANLVTCTGGTNNSYISKVNPKDGTCILKKTDTTDFFFLGNFFICEGKPGKVLEIKAAQRTGSDNFVTCVRKNLEAHYGTQPVGIGGTFLIEKGQAKIHIMSDFSETPLTTAEDINNWLNFYDVAAGLVCIGDLMSYDPGLDLRVEHFHGYSEHGDGGHYLYDVTPGDVSYLAYFNIAEYMYRVDQPEKSHNVGHD